MKTSDTRNSHVTVAEEPIPITSKPANLGDPQQFPTPSYPLHFLLFFCLLSSSVSSKGFPQQHSACLLLSTPPCTFLISEKKVGKKEIRKKNLIILQKK
jgi:hypothetical protein